MKRILVTGATGFVGSNIIRYLADKGVEIDALVRSDNTAEGAAKSFTWEQLGEIDFGEIDSIIHLSGKAHDVRNVSDESEYFEINVELTDKLARQACSSGFSGQFIHFSSVKAVADHVVAVLDEDASPDPQTVYGRSKLESEKRLQDIFYDSLNQLFILRPCMIHGPGNKGNLNLLYQFVGRGIPYPLAAFENERSLLGIGNLCYVVHQIIAGKVPGGTYNVADSGTISTSDIVSVIAKVSGKSVRKWKVPKSLIRLIAKFGDWVPSPLDSNQLQKLTENYRVSNAKMTAQLERPLPESLRDGLTRTIKSFL